MRKRGSGLDEAMISCATNQLLAALAFLHSCCIMHRDLNASNVLLGEGGIVKVADFGVSAVTRTPRDRRSSFIGSPNWMAPEVIACEKDRTKSYDNHCDIWSLGITLIEFAETRAPNSDLHPMKVGLHLFVLNCTLCFFVLFDANIATGLNYHKVVTDAVVCVVRRRCSR